MRFARVAFDPHVFDPLVRVALGLFVYTSIVRIELDPLVAFVLRARVSIWVPFERPCLSEGLSFFLVFPSLFLE